MDSVIIENIKQEAAEILRCHKRLEKLHQKQIRDMELGAMTRSRTTTYNANAANYAEARDSHRAELQRLRNEFLGHNA